jgi:hypothetical protein
LVGYLSNPYSSVFMSNRNRWIGGVAGLALLVAGVVWWSARSSSSSVEEVATRSLVVPVTVESRAPVEIRKAPDTAKLIQPAIADLLTDGGLKDSEVRSGLAKISLDNTRKLDERNEATSHLLNLTAGGDEAELLVLVRDPLLRNELARRVFEDAFNRPHSFQADLCLELMNRKDAESLVIAAREHLLFLLGPEVDAASNAVALKAAVDAAKKRWAEEAAQ